jgi:hypothetical protein
MVRRAPFVCKLFHLCLCEKPRGSAQLVRSYDAQGFHLPVALWYCACIHSDFGPKLHFRHPSPEALPAIDALTESVPRVFLRLQTIVESVNLAPHFQSVGGARRSRWDFGNWVHASPQRKSDAASRSGATYHAPLRHASAGLGPVGGQRSS